MPVLWREMNCRLGKLRFNSLMILLNSESSFSTTLRNHTKKMRKKMTKSVCWGTEEDNFHKKSKIKV